MVGAGSGAGGATFVGVASLLAVAGRSPLALSAAVGDNERSNGDWRRSSCGDDADAAISASCAAFAARSFCPITYSSCSSTTPCSSLYHWMLGPAGDEVAAPAAAGGDEPSAVPGGDVAGDDITGELTRWRSAAATRAASTLTLLPNIINVAPRNALRGAVVVVVVVVGALASVSLLLLSGVGVAAVAVLAIATAGVAPPS